MRLDLLHPPDQTALPDDVFRARNCPRRGSHPGAPEMSPTVLGSESCLLQAASARNLKTLSFKDGRESVLGRPTEFRARPGMDVSGTEISEGGVV